MAHDSDSDDNSGSSRSGSQASKSNGSRSPSGSGSNRSGSNSPASNASRRSGSGSPASQASGRSGSPNNIINSPKASRSPDSRSRSPSLRSQGSRKSHTRSPEGSQAASPQRSRSGSPKESPHRSRSGSPKASPHRSKSGSPMSVTSAKSHRSRSSSASSTHEPPTERKDVEASGSEEEGVAQRERSNSRGSSSGSDIVQKPRVRSVNNSDDDDDERKKDGDDEENQKNIGNEDIFGDDLSISSDDDDKEKKMSDDQRDDVERYEDDEEEQGEGSKNDDDNVAPEKPVVEEEEPIPETRIDVEVPKITTDLGKEIHFVKLPNFLSVDARPFDPETYEDEIEDEDSLDEEGRARLKLKVENTIRWKIGFDEEGKPIKKSNSRFVRWSDGSLSLHLGSEVFDVYKQPLQGDFNHLFIRQGTGLQGQAVFRTKLSFRPYSTESFTHQKMTRSMADRSNKATGIKVISSVGKNPEMNRWQRMKEEEERLRASLRRDNKQRRVKERSTSKGLSGGFLEDGSDEEGVSLSAIKNKYKKGRKDNKPIYTSDEDDSDIDISKTKKLESAKSALRDSDEESNRSRNSSGSSNKSVPRSVSRSVSRSRSRSKSKSASRSRSRSKSDSE
ncbi:uncharacterized protein Atu [Lepeophtheirus salmonis]|uniref:uncharacterized protein Atu n=1 Tax=Lepeophtheirus salmonis TaxID=72036 RepID=UPI001AE99B76|nr:another transcription unit protein-like [Lepeophtheirus salmonis]